MPSQSARALGALVIALALAGCGGGGGGTSTPPVSGAPAGGTSGTGGTVSGASLSISPNNLQYTDASSAPQTFTVSSSTSGVAAPQIDGSTCAGIVTIAGGGGTLPQTYTVTPVAGSTGGGCTVVFVSGTNAATIGIAMGGPGNGGYHGLLTVTAAPTSLAFGAAGAAAQTFTVNAGGGAGPGTASVDAAACAGIATVTGSAAAPPASFTVTPVGTGGCSLVVVDGFAATTIPVTVGVTAATAAVTVSPASLTFASPTATPQSVSVGFQGYVGTVTVNQSACAGIAQFTIPNGSLPQTGTVTPLAAGSCTITFSATNAPAVNLAVTVQ